MVGQGGGVRARPLHGVGNEGPGLPPVRPPAHPPVHPSTNSAHQRRIYSGHCPKGRPFRNPPNRQKSQGQQVERPLSQRRRRNMREKKQLRPQSEGLGVGRLHL